MYIKFYNLRELPFHVTPDPRFLYWTRHHREAFEQILYGIQNRKGFIELTGDVGSGKTTLCRAILSTLGSDVSTALLLNPCLSPTQLLRAMLNDFGLPIRGRDRLAYIEALNEFLLEQNRLGNNVALFIDEAQDLSSDVMEQIRLLSNLETDQHKLIQMVLCGQPELRNRLDQPELRQLRQRIAVRCYLSPLTLEETMRYIEHRLKVAGSDGRLTFEPEAVREIYRYSRGCPRLINAICDGALLAGYVARSRDIDLRCVQTALEQLRGRHP